MRRLDLRYPTVDALREDHEKNLSKARAFVTDAGTFGDREACDLALHHPESKECFLLRAEVVWVGPKGVGFALTDLDSTRRNELALFAGGGSQNPTNASDSALDSVGDEESPSSETAHRSIHDRVRSLTAGQREEMARRGALPERVALERAYGGAVWEGLLQNAQITLPEVARIAKNGGLPRPLVAVIVANASWLGSGEIQRALLGNPRCTGSQLDRVLTSMRPADLSRLVQHCPYRPEVRTAALRLAKPR